MTEHFPGFRAVLDLPWVTIWEGELTPISAPYKVRMVDHRGMDDGNINFGSLWPSVRVQSPLARRDEAPHEPVPHLYGSHDDPRGAELCLFLPRSREWNEYMLLADSIVRWTAEWLFYYEMWHVTGAWGGDEAEHMSPTPPMAPPPFSNRRHLARYINAPVMRSLAYLVR